MKNSDIQRLVRIVGSQRRTAKLLGVTDSHVSRMIHGGKEVQQYVTVIADLLEKMPRADWPASVLAKVDG